MTSMQLISRRGLLAGSAAATVAGLGSPARAADKLRAGKAIVSSFPFAGLELGQQKGTFASEGIEIEISTFAGDARMQQALAAGSLDVAVGSGPGMGYAAKGVPAHAVAALASEPRNMSLVVTNNSPVKKLDDLKGKKIGVTTAGSLTDWLTRRLAQSKGWGADGIEVVPMGDMRTRLAAMKTGELAGSVNSIEESRALEEQGQGQMLATFGDAVPDFHTHVIFAHDDLIKNKPDVLKRFLRGWFKTCVFMRDNRAETVASIATTMSISAAVVDAAYEDELKMLSFDGAFSPKALEVIRGSLKELGILDFTPEAKDLYVPGFAPVTL